MAEALLTYIKGRTGHAGQQSIGAITSQSAENAVRLLQQRLGLKPTGKMTRNDQSVSAARRAMPFQMQAIAGLKGPNNRSLVYLPHKPQKKLSIADLQTHSSIPQKAAQKLVHFFEKLAGDGLTPMVKQVKPDPQAGYLQVQLDLSMLQWLDPQTRFRLVNGAQKPLPPAMQMAFKNALSGLQGIDMPQATPPRLKVKLSDNERRAMEGPFLEDVVRFTYERIRHDIRSTHAEKLRETLVINRIKAYSDFIKIVKKNAPWDLKSPILMSFNHNKYFYDPVTKKLFRFDIFGNIHYGYLGRSIGFTAAELILGAGVFHRIDNPNSGPITDFLTQPFSLDDPKDKAAVELGMDLWRRYKFGVSLRSIVMSVQNNVSKLAYQDLK